ncbi:MAG: glycosyltransferase [Cyclobacteriaceae bacterium]|nr:glycosyltransferase [Cyclobacteriaceae bacterium]MDH5248142.1 glycosyltransferase [Cyclobacteriaceae bacterium]
MKSSSALRILIIIPNLGRGGAQQVFWQQMNHLALHFEVFGCVFNWDGAFEQDKLGNIISLDVPGGKTWLQKVYYFIIRILRLRKIKKDRKIDISISHLEGADYVNLLSRYLDRTICWVHGTKRFDENITGTIGLIRHRILMPVIYRRAQKIVTVSRGIRDELSRSYPSIVPLLKTIYNGFDIEGIQQSSREETDENFVRLCGTSSVIITHCRLSRQKNLTALVRIFEKVAKIAPSKLAILGDGELRHAIIDECSALQLKTWTCWDGAPFAGSYDVYFMGQQQNPFKYLKHAHLYAMTSGWEGFPLALCEAMAIGLPVMAADCFTGPREIIAPDINSQQPVQTPFHTQYGVLMPLADRINPRAIEHWTSEIVNLLGKTNVSKTQTTAGIGRIQEFSFSETMEQTVSLIGEVANVNTNGKDL